MAKSRKIIISVLAAAAALCIAMAVYLCDYYSSEYTVEQIAASNAEIKYDENSSGTFIDGAGTEDILIFYPGGKVEYTSYLPLLTEFAEKGIDCYLLKMPGNLAVFSPNAADKVIENIDAENIYVGGHSLGGAMAASYAAHNTDSLKGLLLLGAYPTEEISGEDFTVVSIYGSKDTIVNRDKIKDGRKLIMCDYNEYVIDGGNHAWFGAYGVQDGDGEAEITQEEQWSVTCSEFLKAINDN